jgi:hypothetical protein
MLGEILGVGTTSKKVKEAYGMLIEKAGSEFAILMDRSIGDIERLNCPGIRGELLSAAVDRMRKGEVSITAGYDGVYGVIHAFPPGMVPGYRGPGAGAGLFEEEPEGSGLRAGDGSSGPEQANSIAEAPARLSAESGKIPGSLSSEPAEIPGSPSATSTKNPGSLSIESGGNSASPLRPSCRGSTPDNQPEILSRNRFIPDPDQERAINHPGGPAMIIAGPGTGKTAVLARSIARLMDGPNKAGVRVLALSFTVKASKELRERISRIMGSIDAAVLP